MDYKSQYLTIRSLANNNTITFRCGNYVSTSEATSMSFSTDNGQNWTTMNVSNNSQQTIQVTLQSGETAIWKGIANQWAVDWTPTSRYSDFSATGIFEVEGNIMSLLDGSGFTSSTTIKSQAVRNLFRNCNKLTNAKNLIMPALDLTNASSCYDAMFCNCTELVYPPELPATGLSLYCYSWLFNGCSKLVEAPILPTKTLAQNCYDSMFGGCSKINSITCLATNISASNCLYNWVTGVSATGIFYKDEDMNSWPRGNNGIPTNWTVEDYSEKDFSVDVDTIDADYTGGTFTVELTSELQWAVAVPVEWFTVSPESGLTSSTLTITVAPNYGNARTATLLISDEDADEIEITISQDKYPVLIPFNNIYRGGTRLN